MNRIWMAINASRNGNTRLLATDGPRGTLLKACLKEQPSHPRAMETIVEGLSLWEGRRIDAVFAVDAWGGPSLEAHGLHWLECRETPLYSLEVVVPERRRDRRNGVSGLGDFRDLYSVLRREVAK